MAEEGTESCKTQQLGADSAGAEVAKKVLSRESPRTSVTCKAKPGRMPTALCMDPV